MNWPLFFIIHLNNIYHIWDISFITSCNYNIALCHRVHAMPQTCNRSQWMKQKTKRKRLMRSDQMHVDIIMQNAKICGRSYPVLLMWWSPREASSSLARLSHPCLSSLSSPADPWWHTGEMEMRRLKIFLSFGSDAQRKDEKYTVKQQVWSAAVGRGDVMMLTHLMPHHLWFTFFENTNTNVPSVT